MRAGLSSDDREALKQLTNENRDQQLKPEIRWVWDENYRVCGARKVWKQLNRVGLKVARCTAAWLMREMGLRGVARGKKVKTTQPAAVDGVPLEGQPRLCRKRTDIALNALEQALYDPSHRRRIEPDPS